MFTGIVEGMGQVVSIAPRGPAYRFVVDLGSLAEGTAVGDSIALDGTCLTAVSVHGPRVEFDVIQETVERTAFASVRPGDRVNIERSMPAQGRFHGHFVMGHVDGTGRIAEKKTEPRQVRIKIEAPRDVVEQMIFKGSVALDGVSLTLIEVTDTSFSVAIIPHTLLVTTLGAKGEGSLVNVEVDLIGKWIRKLLGAHFKKDEAAPAPGEEKKVVLPSSETLGLTFDALRKYGLG
jgi:riboflavin synthase